MILDTEWSKELEAYFGAECALDDAVWDFLYMKAMHEGHVEKGCV